MPTRKTASTKKAASKKAAKTSAAISGPVPPYGIAIREAVSRGNPQELKKVATAGRKWLKDVQTALDKLEQALAKQK